MNRKQTRETCWAGGEHLAVGGWVTRDLVVVLVLVKPTSAFSSKKKKVYRLHPRQLARLRLQTHPPYGRLNLLGGWINHLNNGLLTARIRSASLLARVPRAPCKLHLQKPLALCEALAGNSPARQPILLRFAKCTSGRIPELCFLAANGSCHVRTGC